MSPRNAQITEPQVPPAPVVRHCRRCRRRVDAGRVYCSVSCLEADDQRAAVLIGHVALRREWIRSTAAELDAQIERLQLDRRRVVGAAEADVAVSQAELATIQAHIADAKAAGEVRFELASDRPATDAAGRMA